MYKTILSVALIAVCLSAQAQKKAVPLTNTAGQSTGGTVNSNASGADDRQMSKHTHKQHPKNSVHNINKGDRSRMGTNSNMNNNATNNMGGR